MTDPTEELIEYGKRLAECRSNLADLFTEKERLGEAVADTAWKATPLGHDESGAITSYVVPAGTLHRLVGTAQSVGISASFRSSVGAVEDHAATSENVES